VHVLYLLKIGGQVLGGQVLGDQTVTIL